MPLSYRLKTYKQLVIFLESLMMQGDIYIYIYHYHIFSFINSYKIYIIFSKL